MPRTASKIHPHAPVLEGIGRARVMSHFNLSTQGFSTWKTRGVPKPLERSVGMLAGAHGVHVPSDFYTQKKGATND